MDPPRRPSSSRRSTFSNICPPFGSLGHDTSPSPLTSESRMAHEETALLMKEPVESPWEESSRTTKLQIELAECIETKTVTTTTTTKRSYPPLIVQPPRSLHSLDTKEFPLALKPTPYELTNFSYEVGGEMIHFRSDEPRPSSVESRIPTAALTPRNSNRLRQYNDTFQYFETPTGSKSFGEIKSRSDESRQRRSRIFSLPPRSPDSMGRLANKSAPRIASQPQLFENRSIENPRTRLESRAQSAMNNLPTLDITERGQSSRSNKTTLGSMFPVSNEDQSADEGGPSSSVGNPSPSFASAVATPPITDTDLTPFDSSFDRLAAALTESTLPRPTLNTSDIQNASLPSPSLSPTFAAASLAMNQDGDEDTDITDSPFLSQSADSQVSGLSQHSRALQTWPQRSAQFLRDTDKGVTVMDTQSMLDTFDSMPAEMKTFMLYQFLRRCPRKTLHVVADVVNPALKCDFLEELPPELSLQILSFLNHRDLCRAAQVSKRWRNIIDSNETGWKELLDRDEILLPAGELEKAIVQGWGWQDPSGPDGWERDLSRQPKSIESDAGSSSSSSKPAPEASTPTSRATIKRKRALGSLGLDRNKRQAVSQEINGNGRHHDSRAGTASTSQRSEGPNAAATAAALAVPNPNLGLPSLRKIHLFKSLYRRHYMLQRNWMSGKVQPHHMAFPAHPRHVITCLQFDDDKILTGSDDTFIHVYDTKTGKLRRRLEGHEGGVWALQYEGNVLVSGSTDRSVRVWDIEKGLCTQVFQGHTSTVRCLQILMPVNTGVVKNGKAVMLPEKPLIITGSRDSQLRIWRLPAEGAKRSLTAPPDVDCPYFVRVLQGHTHSVRAIAAHQDTLISGSYDCSVRVWKISTGETLHQLRGHDQKVYSVVLDHKRERCISGSMDNKVKIWSIQTGACLYTLEGHTSLVGLLDLSGDRLVSAAADSTLRVWDPVDGTCKMALTAHTGAITCFQHDSKKVISGSDRTLKMWDVSTGECLQDLLTDLSGVWQVKFDARRCVAAVQRESLTYIEVLDFGASRDGIPASQRGRRILLEGSDVDRITDDDDFNA